VVQVFLFPVVVLLSPGSQAELLVWDSNRFYPPLLILANLSEPFVALNEALPLEFSVTQPELVRVSFRQLVVRHHHDARQQHPPPENAVARQR